jgi:hypothetical protein
MRDFADTTQCLMDVQQGYLDNIISILPPFQLIINLITWQSQLNYALSILAAATAQTSPQPNHATIQAVLPSPRPAPGSRGPLTSSTHTQSVASLPVVPTPYISPETTRQEMDPFRFGMGTT